jgi:SAM-dependent methyltransferase
MRRRGIHRPTIEDLVELSGIETLHPGGMQLTRRTGEVAGLKPGTRVLDVSSGRGTQAIFYAETFGADVTGVDLSDEMLAAARANARAAGISKRVRFEKGDSQALPFPPKSFDVVINECAAGIPDDSQAVINEMVRVARTGGVIAMHESTWRASLSSTEKDDFSERYGTTPLEFSEWEAMLEVAGLVNIKWEFDEWSMPEMFWNIRKGRVVHDHAKIFTKWEESRTLLRVIGEFGLRGVFKAYENKRVFFEAVTQGKLGYCLFWGEKP